MTVSELEFQALRYSLRRLPGIALAVFHTPVDIADPLLRHDSATQAMLQLYFHNTGHLESSIGAGSVLPGLLREAMPGLVSADIEIQAMQVHSIPVATAGDMAGETCAYVVGYEGGADDTQTWVHEYRTGHALLMRDLPGVRQIEVYTRLNPPVDSTLAAQHWMLRNKVVFDTPAALRAALESPVRKAMKQHRAAMPALDGHSEHVPMLARIVALS